MIGADFRTFWEAGLAILRGSNPYLVPSSIYPPATTYLFSIFGLLPFEASLALWIALSLALLIHAARRRTSRAASFSWLLFTPALFNFMTGQIDVPFFWLATFLPGGGWKAVICAALITLKPQLALVLLPWFLVRWLKSDRRLLFRWVGAALLLHLLPLIFDPAIYAKWLEALQGVAGYKLPLSSGVFGLVQWGLPLWLLALPALGLAAWSLFQDEMTARAALLLASPLTIWYDDLLLATASPAKFLVPVSGLAFLLAALLQSSLPLGLIPAAVLGWKWFGEKKGKALP